MLVNSSSFLARLLTRSLLLFQKRGFLERPIFASRCQFFNRTECSMPKHHFVAFEERVNYAYPRELYFPSILALSFLMISCWIFVQQTKLTKRWICQPNWESIINQKICHIYFCFVPKWISKFLQINSLPIREMSKGIQIWFVRFLLCLVQVLFGIGRVC